MSHTSAGYSLFELPLRDFPFTISDDRDLAVILKARNTLLGQLTHILSDRLIPRFTTDPFISDTDCPLSNSSDLGIDATSESCKNFPPKFRGSVSLFHLSTTIFNLYNLPKLDIRGWCDPYVTAACPDSKVFFMGRTLPTAKTSTKRSVKNVAFNESLDTFIPNSALYFSSRSVEAPKSGTYLEEVPRLVLTVWDWDKVSSNDYVGYDILCVQMWPSETYPVRINTLLIADPGNPEPGEEIQRTSNKMCKRRIRGSREEKYKSTDDTEGEYTIIEYQTRYNVDPQTFAEGFLNYLSKASLPSYVFELFNPWTWTEKQVEHTRVGCGKGG